MLLYHALSYHTGRHAISPYYDAFGSLFFLSSVVSAPMKRKKDNNIQIMIMKDVKIYVEKTPSMLGYMLQRVWIHHELSQNILDV